MKELSIEEKAKRYDEAIERAKAYQGLRSEMEIIFPELKESDDEKIRETLIENFKWFCGDYPETTKWGKDDNLLVKDIIAWLEKRGEQKPVISDDALREGIVNFGITQYQIDNWLKKYVDVGRQCEQKPADKVEPKFKVGDWVVRNGETLHISNIDEVLDGTFHYWFTKGTWLPSSKMEDAYLWTIQDAKAGDVLATEGFVFIFKKIREDKCVGYFCANEKELHEGDDSTFHIANPNSLMGSINNDFTHYTPATKEQRNLLFQKMHEAGYEWDAEKLELKNIEQNPTEWKGEDYGIYKSIIDDAVDRDLALTATQKEWIRNLKPQPKQEWSEEDEKMLECAIDMIEWYSVVDKSKSRRVSDWLKSLKIHWKPSDEQMKALKHAFNDCSIAFADMEILATLYEQLKALHRYEQDT